MRVVRARAAELIECRRLSTAERGDRAAGPTAAAAGRRTGCRRRRRRLAGERFFGTLPEDGTTADARRVDQPDARRAAGRRSVGARVRRGRRRQGRRLRRHPRAAADGRAPTVCSTRCSTSRRSSASPSAPGCRACCRSRRSSTSPTCTTPSTSCAARRRRCRSSRPASTSTRWSCASPATATRRASAATSTTTTPSAVCATFPASSSPRRRRGSDAAAMLRTCAAAAKTDGTVCALPRADRPVPHPRPARRRRRRLAVAVRRPGRVGGGATCRSAAGASPATATDVLIATWANGLYLSLRVAERLRVEGISCRVLDLRWLVPLPVDDLLANAADVGRVVVVDETRHQGGVGEASSRRSSKVASAARSPGSPRATRSFRSATRRTSCSCPRTTSPTPCGRSAALTPARSGRLPHWIELLTIRRHSDREPLAGREQRALDEHALGDG